MFEHLRQSLRDLLDGRVAPGDRRALLAQMKDTLVQARIGVADLQSGVETTQARLARERHELETIERRKRLAAGIGDAETVGVAERYERMHGERIAVLARKLEAQEAELFLLRGELESMTTDFKAAMAGVGSGFAPGVQGGADPAELDGAEALRQQLDSLGRSQGRAAADSRAEEMLEALKRRMGK
ncbi:MAG TPA: hypothetical protein VMM18_07925 [Gemmatimonadaceae bacterium]|nr:hypothetical protein [Gemmatimonadaceae bacterium]